MSRRRRPRSPRLPPQTVPVAPRGSVPDATAAPSAAWTTAAVADPFLPTGVADLTAFAVPSGIVPTVPGCARRAGTRCSGGAARIGAPGWLPEAPSIPDLGWSGAPPAAPAGDEASYHFLTSTDPVPLLRDEHEVFDVNAVRADFPILKETVNGKPLIWFDNAATTQKPQVVIDRLAYFYAHENSNIHRAAHELAARATDAYEEARNTVRAIHRCVRGRRDHLRARHHRGDQPGGLCLGRQAFAARRRDRHHPPRAPRQYRSVATTFAADRRHPASRAGRRRRQPAAVGVRGSAGSAGRNWLPRRRFPTRWAR